MTKDKLFIGKNVFVIPFKGHQFQGIIVDIKNNSLIIETKDGTRKISISEAKTIGNV